MKKIILLLLLLYNYPIYAQTYKVEYNDFYNKKLNSTNENIVISNGNLSLYTNAKKSNKININYYYNFDTGKVTYKANLKGKEVIYTQYDIIDKKIIYDFKSETKKINGHLCSLAETFINSNKYEIWYTNDLKVKGSPLRLGANLGLVLEINMNNNYSITANKITKLNKNNSNLEITEPVTYLSHKDYTDSIFKAKYQTISIFENDTINFNENTNQATLNNITKYSKGTIITKKIKLPKLDQNKQVFLDLTSFSQGDAYDRTGSVFVILPNKTKITFEEALINGIKKIPSYKNQYQGMVITPNYEPILELMRFFTPFGVKKFNQFEFDNINWSDKVYYRQEISEFNITLSEQEVIIGIYIGNYDKHGHNVSLNLTIHDGTTKFNNYTYLQPIFNTVNILEMSGQNYPDLFKNDEGLKVDFEIKEDVKNGMFRYTTTGHGGWVNGDEFLLKTNSIFLNNDLIHSFTPWRVDCGSYRDLNPASGNFENGLSSSDLSRANWCPGTVTNPNFIFLGDLKKGKHSIQIKIPQGPSEGESRSFWNVSGVLLAN